MSPAEIGGIAGGAALIACGGVWRVVVLNRRRRRLDRALADSDPMVRIATLDLLTERGVSGHLGTLVERVLLEGDPRVQTALIRTVVRSQWEPNSDPRVILLRAWATRMATGLVSGTPDDPTVRPGEVVRAAIQEGLAKALPTGPEAHDESIAVDEGVEVSDPSREPEFELLPESEQRVMDWLLSSEAAGSPPPANAPRSATTPTLGSSSSMAKAEQKAVDLLQAAGYGVAPKHRDEAVRAPGTHPEPSAIREADERRLFHELQSQQGVRLELLEEMIRRVRAENARLEAELRGMGGSPGTYEA